MDEIKHDWDALSHEVSDAVQVALKPVYGKVLDDLYATVLETTQDYLTDNLQFNISSRINSARREAESLRAINKELINSLREMKGWVKHWKDDVAGNLKPTESSLNHAQQMLEATLAKVEGK